MNTKIFSLRVVLSVATGRLLTEPVGGRTGVEQLCEIVEWMTGEPPSLLSFLVLAEQCKPHLLAWFPELLTVSLAIDSLDEQLKLSAPGHKPEGVSMWLAELRIMFPDLRDSYEVRQITTE